MSNKPKMGRGIDALWNNSTPDNDDVNTQNLSLAQLTPNPNQPRKNFDEQSLEELAASIKEQGIIQPLLVRPHNDGYEIVAGERRWRAAQKAGLVEVPVFIKNMSDEEVLAAALIENIQRENLSPIEEALALNSLREECGITQEELAKRLGKSRSAIANTLRLLQLNIEAQESLTKGIIQAGHARTLLSLQNDTEAQEILHQYIIEQELSVRDAEAAVTFYKENTCFPWDKNDIQEQSNINDIVEQNKQKDIQEMTEEECLAILQESLMEYKDLEQYQENTQEQPKSSSRKKSPYLKSLQDTIKNHLTIKTSISGNEERGRITLTYTNAQELTQILLHMGIEQDKETIQ